MTSHNKNTRIENYRSELIDDKNNSIFFKDYEGITKIKEKINNIFHTHFYITPAESDKRDFKKEAESQAKASLKNSAKNSSGHIFGAKKSSSRFDKKIVQKKKKLIGLFSDMALRLGYDIPARDINKRMVQVSIIITTLLSLIIIGMVLANHKTLDVLITFLLFTWTFVFAAIFLFVSLLVFVYVDIIMHQRVRQIEEALPDFLQLASANISAGMTVDRALWYAVRPKFGILATEMENVAKSTVAGEDLEKALLVLSRKYDSRILKETINLIVEGIQSGGEMGSLLSKLSGNIKETQLMKKEISASVMTYAIFIGVATVVAAPVLFALSTQLLIIIQKIFSNIHIDPGAGMSGSFTFNFSGESVSLKDFKRFAILVLVISSFFSAAIISVIRKGTVKDGVKTIPIFIVISLILYFLASAMFSTLMGGMF